MFRINNKILSNFFSLSLSEILSRAANFAAVIFIARYFNVDEFGILGFATSFISYFYLLVNFGFDIYGIREVAKENNRAYELLNKIVSAKLFLSVICFPIIIIISLFFESSVLAMIIILYGLTLFTSTFNIYWYYQAFERMKMILRIKAIESLLYLGITVTLAVSAQSLIVIPLALLFSQAIAYIYYFSHIKFNFFSAFNNSFYNLKKLIKETYMIGLSSLFILVYYNLDLIMLKYFRSDYEVGIYNSAYRIFLVAIVPLQLILATFFPSLSKLGLTPSREMIKRIKNYSVALISTAITISLFLSLFSEPLISLLFGDKFIFAAKPLLILSMNVLVVGINIVFGNPLIAWGKQKQYVIAIGIGALVNVILNFILIPEYSYMGAALATLLAEASVFVGVVICFSKYYFRVVKVAR